MAYTYQKALQTVFEYLEIDENDVCYIPNTNNRGFEYMVNDEKCVIFVSPIGCKKDNKQNWVDMRDSGKNERIITWNYALDNNYKYFCLCVNSEQDRYKDYFFSIENTEDMISDVCYRSKEGVEGTGTQANIPNWFKPSKKFERFVTDKGFYFAVIKKEYIAEYLKMFDNRPYTGNKNKISIEPDDVADETTTEPIDNICYNKIYYGIPGCGKSYMIQAMLDYKEKYQKKANTIGIYGKVDKADIIRTTFFLDYSNSDFIGQIYPQVKGKDVTYEYVPGPFTKALERALTVDKNHMVYLVIEEINRGNAAAIFGDLFQLLDRLNDEKDGRVKGDSEYPISNQFIEGYFFKQNEEGAKIKFEEGNIYIPHNLVILATMNTSDQNVYPLDTAFQRRWDREKVVSDIDNSTYADWYVPGTQIKWKDFAKQINIHMVEECKDGSITEDKNLGAYFATSSMLCEEDEEPSEEKIKRFANNVMEYLLGTAVKFTPEILFNKDYKRYQKVYDEMSKFELNNKQSKAFIAMLADKVANDIKKDSPDAFADGE